MHHLPGTYSCAHADEPSLRSLHKCEAPNLQIEMQPGACNISYTPSGNNVRPVVWNSESGRGIPDTDLAVARAQAGTGSKTQQEDKQHVKI